MAFSKSTRSSLYNEHFNAMDVTFRATRAECVFGVLGLEVFLRVDFRFLLIEWVLGTELLAKDSC
jgi:hypothetical protein